MFQLDVGIDKMKFETVSKVKFSTSNVKILSSPRAGIQGNVRENL